MRVHSCRQYILLHDHAITDTHCISVHCNAIYRPFLSYSAQLWHGRIEHSDQWVWLCYHVLTFLETGSLSGKGKLLSPSCDGYQPFFCDATYPSTSSMFHWLWLLVRVFRLKRMPENWFMNFGDLIADDGEE